MKKWILSWFKTQIVVREFPRVTIIRIIGRLDQKACNFLTEKIAAIIEKCSQGGKMPAIILYARWVRSIDHTTVPCLIALRKKVVAINDGSQCGRFVIAHLGRGMRNMIALQKLERAQVPVFTDLWAAQQSFS